MALVMMRVTRIQDGNTPPRLHVEGRLTHETAKELTMECHALMRDHGSLDLDVSELQFADAAGVATLLDLERGGVRLQRRAGLVDALLRDEDRSLVARLRDGDADAFEALVRQHGGRMLATARRMLPSEDDARDTVQEALLSAF